MSVRKQIVDVDNLDVNKEYSRVARMHKYWSRKPWFIIEQYVNKYSSQGETVLDPFMGSGSTGLEAILQGRDFYGYDLNPFSQFLSDCTLDVNFSPELFDLEFKQIQNHVKEKIMSYYHISENRYILYAILGPKNTKEYNLVSSDYNHKDKLKKSINNISSPKIKLPYDIPDKQFPVKFYKDRFSYKGVKNVSDMFTDRNLASLSVLYHYLSKSKLKYKKLFLLAFSNTLLHASKLKSENIRPLGVNNYWLPDDYIEENVWWRFADRVNNVRVAKQTLLERKNVSKSKNIGNYFLFNKSALSMNDLDSESVDYIFTDPPYGDAIQYSELSFIWNTWLNKTFKIKEEVIINPVQNKSSSTFNKQLAVFLLESARVLKKGRHITLCFQNKNIAIWTELSKVIKSAGYGLVDVSVYDTLGSPYNKSWAKYSPKSDFYITFKKLTAIEATKTSTSISADKILKKSLNNLDPTNFNIGRAYDEFVINLIESSFKYSEIIGAEKLNLKTVIHLFQENIDNGNI